jgi:hypothetical protein
MRVRRSSIQAAEFKLGSEDCFDIVENLGHGDDFLKDLSFGDKIREAAGAGLLTEFGTGVLTF